MLQTILKYLWERRTTVFGYVQIALGYMVATQGLFGDDTMKWLLFLNGLLTALLGHYNNVQIKALRAAAQAPDRESGFACPSVLLVLAALTTLFLVACALPTPRSYDQRVQGAYATLAVVNDTAVVLRNADVISVDDARAVQAQTRQALAAVDIAASLNPPLGDGQLADALAFLKAAQDLLCKDRPTEPNCQYLLQRTQL